MNEENGNLSSANEGVTMDEITDEDELQGDICRVCRMPGSAERPLYYPCVCTGSIKFIHQECLTRWLNFSKKEYCELCHYKYTFMPIYHPDMPGRLPFKELICGVGAVLYRGIKCWLHYTIVALTWLAVVPLSACRIYRCLFAGSVNSVLTLPLDMLSRQNLVPDCIQGVLILAITLFAFVALVWLREQIVLPEWLNRFHEMEIAAAAAANVDEHNNDDNEQVDDVQAISSDDEEELELAADAVIEDAGLVAAQPELPGGDNNLQNEHQPAAQVNQQDVLPEAAGAPVDEIWQPFADWGNADELTWERLLGLDGSLIFLEHVFWVIALNTLFVLVFAFSPFHIGQFALEAAGFNLPLQEKCPFPSLATVLVGYFIIGFLLYLTTYLCLLLHLPRAGRALGICYLVIKVVLLGLIELGFFPLFCGIWLDICSLQLFAMTPAQRFASFYTSPASFLFFHWMAGIITVFYLASFILLMRDVLRPGLLWFLRNLNDPDFNPVQEMLVQPVYRHLRRFLVSKLVFGIIIALVAYVPVCIIQHTFPLLLPYHVSISVESLPLSELSLELLILQIIIPSLLEQGHMRLLARNTVHFWMLYVGKLLDIDWWLLPSNEATNDDRLQRRPNKLVIKVLVLLLLLAMTTVITSVIVLTLPVAFGRALIYIVLQRTQTHDIYCLAAGIYVCYLIIRVLVTFMKWFQHGFSQMVAMCKQFASIASRCLICGFPLFGIVPLMLGMLFQLIVLTPIRVPIHQTPLFYPWQDWAMGILHCKILCAAIMMGPDWWLKEACNRVYQAGVRNLDVCAIYNDIILPVMSFLGICLSVPYLLTHYAASPLYDKDRESELLFRRHIYPCMLLCSITVVVLVWQFGQLRSLVLKIRNDRYLVGQRLVNYIGKKPESIEASIENDSR